MNERRSVRVDPRFLEQLDAQLGEERGPNGEPSRIDFLRFELPAIEDDFALRFRRQGRGGSPQSMARACG